MICDLCDKDQQNICERTFHFVKPINECLMRKAQENREIIEELENLKADMNENLCPTACEDCQFYDSHFYAKSGCRVTDFIDKHIAELKGENK